MGCYRGPEEERNGDIRVALAFVILFMVSYYVPYDFQVPESVRLV